MADVPGKFFSATKVRTGVAPSSSGSIVGEPLPPVNPPGSSLNSVGLTMPSAFTVSNSPLTANGTIGVAGAGTVGQYIRGDGSLADFPQASGGGSSVSYYLNGSISQGTIGGVAYKELNKVPILGAGTDFTINADGYIASFITDAGDPNKLLIPAGNWNFETYFSASSSGGTPSFYVELYKVSGSTATLIASSSSAPELIAFGTSLNPYFSTLAVPETILTLTDRLAIRYYVTHSGRTITLHTENNHLCQVITTFTTGLTALNGLTSQVQYFAVGTSGSDFNIASATDTHTFNLPTASSTNRGALSSADWALFTQAYNDKINSASVTGTTTKTLTLTQQDGGTITASWTDLNTDAVISVFGRTGAVVAANGDYTTAQVTESGNLYFTNARSRQAISLTTSGTSGAATYDNSTGLFNIPNYGSALSGYLPLTGGTLTGPLGGTSASFSSTLGVTGAANFLSTVTSGDVLYVGSGGSGGGFWTWDGSNSYLIGASGKTFYINANNTLTHNGLLIATTGAATFSSSVTAQTGLSILGTGGVTSSANKVNIDFFGGNSRFYSLGANISTKGGFEFHTNSSNGSLDVIALEIAATGDATFSSLAGSGTRMVVANLNGLLSTQTIPVGTVTSVGLSSATSGVTIGSTPVTTSGTITIAIATASGSQNGLLSSTDWTTFNSKQSTITLTTTGTSGAATFSSNTLNIPNYGSALSGYLPLSAGISFPLTGDLYIRKSEGFQNIIIQPTTTTNAAGTRFLNSGNDMYMFIDNSGGDYGPTGANGASFAYNANIRVVGNRALQIATNDTVRLTIAAGGNVGIGVNPSYGLDLLSNNSARFKGSSNYMTLLLDNSSSSGGGGAYFLQNGAVGGGIGSSGWWIGDTSNDLLLVSASGKNIRFLTNDSGTDKMRITSGGNVLIGTTTNASGKLQVLGSDSTIIAQLKSSSGMLQFYPYFSTYGGPIIQALDGAGANYATLRVECTTMTVAGNQTVNGSLALPHVTKSANYTLDGTDYTVGFDCASNRTANLPDATTCAGRIYVIYQYNTGSGARSVTLDGNGSQTINGVTTYNLSPYCDFSSVMIQSNGSNWIIISSNLTADCL